jgi:hypothetical protein
MAGRELTLCDDTRCAGTAHRLRAALQLELKRRRCSFCSGESVEGRRYCEAHCYQREPCADCGGKVERRSGRGDRTPFKRCPDCVELRQQTRQKDLEQRAAARAAIAKAKGKARKEQLAAYYVRWPSAKGSRRALWAAAALAAASSGAPAAAP